ncbi:hypothetical protein DUNSADRAFT_640 [Dunaliella salina]|uniref:Uncharacterized protein n=1 Tax=Dunaliella salina TaxID=3046 RepID=A0ABZ3KE46_DUNSA|nr:hypothetical protein DUNSADRAFT_640 [Dunaliella salina]|eukprot:KAF5827444.1 hypothetical protein DUNSADRAFT_640 [Dunaliella salina]
MVTRRKARATLEDAANPGEPEPQEAPLRRERKKPVNLSGSPPGTLGEGVQSDAYHADESQSDTRQRDRSPVHRHGGDMQPMLHPYSGGPMMPPAGSSAGFGRLVFPPQSGSGAQSGMMLDAQGGAPLSSELAELEQLRAYRAQTEAERAAQRAAAAPQQNPRQEEALHHARNMARAGQVAFEQQQQALAQQHAARRAMHDMEGVQMDGSAFAAAHPLNRADCPLQSAPPAPRGGGSRRAGGPARGGRTGHRNPGQNARRERRNAQAAAAGPAE